MISDETIRQLLELLGVTEQENRFSRDEHYNEPGVFPVGYCIPLRICLGKKLRKLWKVFHQLELQAGWQYDLKDLA
jgi:hypothetical protein